VLNNQIENENINLNLNEILKDEKAFLAYNENGDLIVVEKYSDLIDIEPKGEEELNDIEIDDLFEDNNINNNNDNFNNNNPYRGSFNMSNSSLSNFGSSRVGFFKRSSMTVSDLTDDSKLLRMSVKVGDVVNSQQNYIEVADWDFEQEENKDKFEKEFKDFEKKFFSE